MDLQRRLSRLCLNSFVALGFPLVRIDRIDVRQLRTERFGKAGLQTCYLLTVTASNAAMLRGAQVAYKGSYKERVEAVVQHHLSLWEPNSVAYVEVVGRSSKSSIDGLVSIRNLVSSGKALVDSPLVATARAYRVPKALIHGRHLIGPSPAVAALLSDVVANTSINRMLDLFAGTGIATKVVTQGGRSIAATVVECDATKMAFLRQHIRSRSVEFHLGDAFTYKIRRKYDLIIADPFYEQALAFLDRQGPSIRRWAKRFLFASGSVEDRSWNRLVLSQLRRMDFRVVRHEAFGQVIFDCEPSA